MSTEYPTLAEVVEKHRWKAHAGRPSDVACTGCNWSERIQNTGKTAIRLHADHVSDVWREECTIRTVEQLNALPPGSVIRDHPGEFGCTFEKASDGEGDVPWWYDGQPHDLVDINLPAQIIWHPDWSK